MGRSVGHARAVLMATSGHFCWPSAGRNYWPLTRPLFGGVVTGEFLKNVNPFGGWRRCCALPPDWIRLAHLNYHIRGRMHGPTPRCDRFLSGWAAHVQGTAERSNEDEIVSYGLPNYAIPIRSYDVLLLATLGRCLDRTTRLKRSGVPIRNASRHRFVPRASAPD